jgi:hypothetical protein
VEQARTHSKVLIIMIGLLMQSGNVVPKDSPVP